MRNACTPWAAPGTSSCAKTTATLACRAALPIQSLRPVSLGVWTTNSCAATSSRTWARMLRTSEPWPDSLTSKEPGSSVVLIAGSSSLWRRSVPSRWTEPPINPNRTPILTSRDRLLWPTGWNVATRPPGSSCSPRAVGQGRAVTGRGQFSRPDQDEVAVGLAVQAVGCSKV